MQEKTTLQNYSNDVICQVHSTLVFSPSLRLYIAQVPAQLYVSALQIDELTHFNHHLWYTVTVCSCYCSLDTCLLYQYVASTVCL